MVVCRSASTVFLILLGTALTSVFLLLPHSPLRHFIDIDIPLIQPQSNNNTIVPPSPHRRLHHLLPINAQAALESPRFCKTLLSALVHGYSPTILNWEVQGDTAYTHRMKVFGVYDYLMNLTTNDPHSESDLVFMMDALDVWLQLPPTSLIARFVELDTMGVVVGADKACWPNPWESPACQDVPPSPLPRGTYGSDPGPENNYLAHTRPRWANSGVVIGPTKAMRELYEDLVEIFRDPITHQAGDQGPFNEMLAARRLSLDYRSRLFWQTASASPRTTAHFLNTPYPIDDHGHPDPSSGTGSIIPHHLYPPLLHLSPTGEIPVAIHFNDHNEKALLDEWWGEFWWNRLGEGAEDQRFRWIVKDRVENGLVRFAGGGGSGGAGGGGDGGQKTWKEICHAKLLAL